MTSFKKIFCFFVGFIAEKNYFLLLTFQFVSFTSICFSFFYENLLIIIINKSDSKYSSFYQSCLFFVSTHLSCNFYDSEEQITPETKVSFKLTFSASEKFDSTYQLFYLLSHTTMDNITDMSLICWCIWVIDFNSMSTRMGLFNAKRLRNCVHCTFLFLCSLSFFCTQFHDIRYSYLMQIIYAQFYGIKYSYLIQIICIQLYNIKYSYLIQIICTQFYDIKYSYLIQIICTQFYDIKYS